MPKKQNDHNTQYMIIAIETIVRQKPSVYHIDNHKYEYLELIMEY